jgi:long-chain acyl-CoA synthetase
MNDTITELWRDAVAAGWTFPAYLVPERDGWREVGWEEAGRRVEELAAGFLELGLRKGDRVAIIGRTRLEWSLADFALASAGIVSVPIYPTSSAADVRHILAGSGARVVVCEDAGQLAKVAQARPELAALEHVLAFDTDTDARPLEEIAELGRRRLADEPGVVSRAAAEIGPDDILTIIYTSGTTGAPKGCVLSQRNYRAMVESVRKIEGLFEHADVILLHLPLAHTFARLVEYAGAIGLTVALLADSARLRPALAAVRPHIFPTVPRVYETVHDAVRANLEEATGLRRRLVDWALAVGRRAAERRTRGRRLGPGLALQHALADRLVFSRVKARLGGRLRVAVSGGAPLAPEIAAFFNGLDITLIEGYGLTEATAAACNWPRNNKIGTVGPPVPDIEVAIADDGEILVRGEIVFQGYFRNDAATAEVVDAEGWLHTGDVGSLDEEGFLAITDRKKDIIVTAGGKNVAPQAIEAALKRSRYIANALVFGDGQPHLVALVAPNLDETAKVASTASEVRALVAGEVDTVNRDLGQAERIRRFAVLDRDFSEDEGEVTPTLKLRRRVIEDRYRDEIERLY